MSNSKFFSLELKPTIQAEHTIQERLVKLSLVTKYPIRQENGQRFFGPPPSWSKPAPKNAEIFLSRLPTNCYEDEIYKFCSQVGEIYLIRFMVNHDGTNRGFCFVTFVDERTALKAVQILPELRLRSRQLIHVEKSHENKSIEIIRIPAHLNEAYIQQELQSLIRNQVSICIKKHSLNNTWKAVVYFENHQQAAVARRELSAIISQKFGNDVKIHLVDQKAKEKMRVDKLTSNIRTHYSLEQSDIEINDKRKLVNKLNTNRMNFVDNKFFEMANDNSLTAWENLFSTSTDQVHGKINRLNKELVSGDHGKEYRIEGPGSELLAEQYKECQIRPNVRWEANVINKESLSGQDEKFQNIELKTKSDEAKFQDVRKNQMFNVCMLRNDKYRNIDDLIDFGNCYDETEVEDFSKRNHSVRSFNVDQLYKEVNEINNEQLLDRKGTTFETETTWNKPNFELDTNGDAFDRSSEFRPTIPLEFNSSGRVSGPNKLPSDCADREFRTVKLETSLSNAEFQEARKNRILDVAQLKNDGYLIAENCNSAIMGQDYYGKAEVEEEISRFFSSNCIPPQKYPSYPQNETTAFIPRSFFVKNNFTSSDLLELKNDASSLRINQKLRVNLNRLNEDDNEYKLFPSYNLCDLGYNNRQSSSKETGQFSFFK